MRCRTASSLMSLQLDGGLPPRELARLSRHLERCARCRAMWVAMRSAHGVLERPPWCEPPPGLTERVLARLPSDRRGVVPLAPAWVRASRVVLAAMVLLFAGLIALTSLLGPGQGDWGFFRQGGREAVGLGGESIGQLLAAFGHVISALWQGLRWPWLPLGGLVLVAAGALWLWIWRRSGTAIGSS
jgi:predicted anti-sigma-YlaC factor YlaD